MGHASVQRERIERRARSSLFGDLFSSACAGTVKANCCATKNLSSKPSSPPPSPLASDTDNSSSARQDVRRFPQEVSSRRLKEDVAQDGCQALVVRREAERLVARAVRRAGRGFVGVEVPDWGEELFDGAKGEVEGGCVQV